MQLPTTSNPTRSVLEQAYLMTHAVGIDRIADINRAAWPQREERTERDHLTDPETAAELCAWRRHGELRV